MSPIFSLVKKQSYGVFLETSQHLGYKDLLEHLEAWALALVLFSKKNRLSESAVFLSMPVSTLSRRRELLKDKVNLYWQLLLQE